MLSSNKNHPNSMGNHLGPRLPYQDLLVVRSDASVGLEARIWWPRDARIMGLTTQRPLSSSLLWFIFRTL